MEVGLTEAETGLPQTTEAALALSKARFPDKGTPTQAEAKPVAEQPGDAQVEVEPKAGTNPPGESEAPKAKPDWSFMADPTLRAALEAANLPPEAHSKFKDWQADYTRKTQAAKAAEAKAAAWSELESDPEMFEVVKEAYAAKVTGKPVKKAEKPKPFDYANATSEEIEAHIEAKAAALAEQRAKALIEAEVKGPITRERQIVAKVEGLYAEVKTALSPDQYRAAWDKARAHYGDGAFTPDNAEVLFRPILDAEVAKAELERIRGEQRKDAGLALRATTPAGTSATVKDAPKVVQKIEPDGKPQTARSKTLEEVEARYGYSRDTLERAARFAP